MCTLVIVQLHHGVADGSEDDLRVQVVRKLRDELRLNRKLLVHQAQVVLKFRVVCDDDTFSIRFLLRTTSTSEHLQNVLRRKFNPAALLRVVDLRALDDDGVRGQVDTPRERRRTDEDLQMTVRE